MTLEFQYAAFLFRLFVLQVVDHLYAPLSDTVKEEQKRYAQMMWQVAPLSISSLVPMKEPFVYSALSACVPCHATSCRGCPDKSDCPLGLLCLSKTC